MRTVMSADKVAAAWTKQPLARTPHRNFTAEDDTLRSYNTAIARKFDWGIVLNVTRYSNTTSGHQYLASTAARRLGGKVYTVRNRPFGDRLYTSKEEVARGYADGIAEAVAKLAKRKSAGPIAENALVRWAPSALDAVQSIEALGQRKLAAKVRATLLQEISRLGTVLGQLPECVTSRLV